MNIPLFAHDVRHGTVEVWKVLEGEEGNNEQLARSHCRVDKDCDYNMCERGYLFMMSYTQKYSA